MVWNEEGRSLGLWVKPQRLGVPLYAIFLMHEYRSSTRCETRSYLVVTKEGDVARRVGLAVFYGGEYKHLLTYRNKKIIKVM